MVALRNPKIGIETNVIPALAIILNTTILTIIGATIFLSNIIFKLLVFTSTDFIFVAISLPVTHSELIARISPTNISKSEDSRQK
jgi:hypothetical protein